MKEKELLLNPVVPAILFFICLIIEPNIHGNQPFFALFYGGAKAWLVGTILYKILTFKKVTGSKENVEAKKENVGGEKTVAKKSTIEGVFSSLILLAMLFGLAYYLVTSSAPSIPSTSPEYTPQQIKAEIAKRKAKQWTPPASEVTKLTPQEIAKMYTPQQLQAIANEQPQQKGIQELEIEMTAEMRTLKWCTSVVQKNFSSYGWPSGFDAYMTPDGTIHDIGTAAELYYFQKCMAVNGWPLNYN